MNATEDFTHMQYRYYSTTKPNMVGQRVALVHAGWLRGVVVEVVDSTQLRIQWNDRNINLSGYTPVDAVEFLT